MKKTKTKAKPRRRAARARAKISTRERARMAAKTAVVIEPLRQPGPFEKDIRVYQAFVRSEPHLLEAFNRFQDIRRNGVQPQSDRELGVIAFRLKYALMFPEDLNDETFLHDGTDRAARELIQEKESK